MEPLLLSRFMLVIIGSAFFLSYVHSQSPPPPSPPPPPPPPYSPPPPPPPQAPPPPFHKDHHSNKTHWRRKWPPPPPPVNQNLNIGKKVGLLFAGIALILQICVVGFLIVKRRQILNNKEQYQDRSSH
ncbi:hypothetical protein ACFE04_003910 [Oxalis oulophora]